MQPDREIAPRLADHLNPLDVESLARRYRAAQPTHFLSIDDFLRPEFARAVAAAYPSFEEAQRRGDQFRWVNEDGKVQITDADGFAEPIRRLHELLASPEILELVSRITGLHDLLADPSLAGGGIHVMGNGGHLDVHVDFNLLQEEQLHRRLNLIVYLSDWQDEWSGEFELWDPEVRTCNERIAPRFNRCMIFNTTTTSFHGVRKIRCPETVTRNSFAVFYYTKQAPEGWDGRFHNTIYKPRPGEWWKGYVRMPLEVVTRRSSRLLRRAYGKLRRLH